MVEGRQHLRFTLEACDVVRIGGQGRRQHLNRDLAPELRIECPVHFAHTTGANLAEYFVVTDGAPCQRSYLITKPNVAGNGASGMYQPIGFGGHNGVYPSQSGRNGASGPFFESPM
jgi:hypothetical protein